MFLSLTKTKNFFTKYDRYLSPLALLVGFIFDNITLTRIDLWLDNLILFSYLFVAGAGIFLTWLLRNSILKGRVVGKVLPVLPILIQFAFGGLFSGYFIFYSRSASLTASWVFILILLLLLIGNEFFRKHYKSLVFQVSIFYFALFSFMIFFVPVITGERGAIVFLLSGIISLVTITIFLYGIARTTPKIFQEKKKILYTSISGIFLVVNILYFTNVIPPIPLSLKDIEVYHFVERNSEGGYIVRSEVKKWYEFDILDKKIHRKKDKPIYI